MNLSASRYGLTEKPPVTRELGPGESIQSELDRPLRVGLNTGVYHIAQQGGRIFITAMEKYTDQRVVREITPATLLAQAKRILGPERDPIMKPGDSYVRPLDNPPSWLMVNELCRDIIDLFGKGADHPLKTGVGDV